MDKKAARITVKFTRQEVLDALQAAYPGVLPVTVSATLLNVVLHGGTAKANDNVVEVAWHEVRKTDTRKGE